MHTVFNLLGFTTIVSSVWNTISYTAFIAIIVGVFSERHRNTLITLGAATLAVYAGIFLKNSLFAILQTLIVISGVLQWAKLPRRFSMTLMVMFTVAAYIFLYASGAIKDGWSLIGSLGLLGIAFGLIVLPKHYGFLLMAVGGLLLIVYAFQVVAWVFFFLNIFFVIANIYTWQKTRGAST